MKRLNAEVKIVPMARSAIAAGATMLCVLVFSTAPALAKTEHAFTSSFGSGPCEVIALEPCEGKFKEPSGVAVNDSMDPLTEPAAGDVYVVDKGNNRVERFSSEGAYLSQFNGSGLLPGEGKAAGSGGLPGETLTGEFSSPEAIAIDNDEASPFFGDVYVADTGHDVIDEFSATGAYLGQLTGTCASPGTCPGSEVSFSAPLLGVAVDPEGNVWVYDSPETVDEFSDTGSFVKAFSTERSAAPGLAVDSSDDVYPICGCESVLKFSSTGTELAEFAEPSSAVAIDSATNNLFVARLGGRGIEEYGSGTTSSPLETFGAGQLSESYGMAVNSASGTVYASQRAADNVEVFVNQPETRSASNLTETSATLNGVVPAGGISVSACEFEYGTTESYGSKVSCAQPTPFSGDEPMSVSANLGGLAPGILYHYRLRVAIGTGEAHGQDQTFTTPVPPTVAEESLTSVASTSATFQAQVNPGGADTTYRVQYGTSTSYGASAPVLEGDAGSGIGAVAVSVQVQGLRPSTVYHYRFVVGNVAERGVAGADQTFTTQGLGGPLTLPDGREWEMVSPVQKLGAQVEPEQTSLMQAAEDGGAISYYLTAPFVANPAGNVRVAQALSRRTSTGWSTEDIATPHTTPSGIGEVSGEYKLFSADLSYALVEPFGETPLSPEASERTPYLRDDATGAYTPLVDPADVPAGTKFGGGSFTSNFEVAAATPDLSHVVLFSSVALTANPSPTGLYMWSAGHLQPIAIEIGTEAGGNGNKRRAISDDGSRVFGNGAMEDMTTGEVLPVPGEFQIASSDGSLAFFSSAGSLNAYNAETAKLTRVTVPLHGADELQDLVLGASEDGSYVYLVDGAVLSEAPNAEQVKAVAGEDNLYVEHRGVNGVSETWTPSFIATLSPGSATGDAPDWEPNNTGAGREMDTQTVEVSPDGQYLAFMSDRSLTGYDNRDASSGEPDEEVYRYDAVASSLVCASCDPTGARPAGRLEAEGGNVTALSDISTAWRDRWVAATIPGLTKDGHFSQALYEPRYMLDNGRLFFDARDALVPQAVNGTSDVYEYESGGTGGCSAASDGCVALLSGGTGPDESAFVDASSSGNDVFFVTADQLAVQDLGSEYDIYDAHVCSSEAPCPASLAQSPPCTNEASCRAPQALQPGVFGPSGSATFSGPGNSPGGVGTNPPAVVKPKTKTVKCKKGDTKNKKGQCVKKKRKKSKRAKKTNRRAK
jgi:hypothetical protein